MAKLSDLPIGAKVRDASTKFNGNIITWIVADKNHTDYPSNSVTLISDRVLTRRRYDSSSTYVDFKVSEIAKWLNNTNGLLAGFSENFKNEILPTSYRYMGNWSGTGFSNLKLFLAGKVEVGFGTKFDFNQYEFPLFSNNDRRRTLDLSNRVSDWMLREHGGSGSLELVDGNGANSFGYPNEVRGIRPLCNLKSDVYISDNADPNGIYNITWNRPPTIESATSSNMGLKTKEFSFTYKVADEDAGQVITVEEYMDNVRTKRFTAQSGSTYTFSLSRPAYQKILNGNHSIKIVVSDDKGGVAEKVFNFSKNETKILVTLDTPLTADAMVTKALINVLGSIPSKAIFKVEACNNAYDANPTWEDCTEKVLNSRKIFFRNNTKTASKWGFNVRVSLDRNGAAGECYISSIGGNFE